MRQKEVPPAAQPVKGQTAYIVDQTGATFAFGNGEDATRFKNAEAANGAENLEQFTVTVPRDGMTWDEVAEYAASQDV